MKLLRSIAPRPSQSDWPPVSSPTSLTSDIKIGRIGHSLPIRSALIVSVAMLVGACAELPSEETGTTAAALDCESQCDAEREACLQDSAASFCESQDDVCLDTCAVGPNAEVVRNLSVLRASHIAVGEPEVDGWLSAATTVLKVVDSSADVACDVRLQRTGSIGLYSGDGIVEDDSDMDRILDFPGNAKLVASIQFCNTFGTWRGCARNPGVSFMVIRNMTATAGGQVWAHEYGHNKGLPHRIGTPLLMNNTPGRTINQTECNAFRQ